MENLCLTGKLFSGKGLSAGNPANASLRKAGTSGRQHEEGGANSLNQTMSWLKSRAA